MTTLLNDAAARPLARQVIHELKIEKLQPFGDGVGVSEALKATRGQFDRTQTPGRWDKPLIQPSYEAS